MQSFRWRWCGVLSGSSNCASLRLVTGMDSVRTCCQRLMLRHSADENGSSPCNWMAERLRSGLSIALIISPPRGFVAVPQVEYMGTDQEIFQRRSSHGALKTKSPGKILTFSCIKIIGRPTGVKCHQTFKWRLYNRVESQTCDNSAKMLPDAWRRIFSETACRQNVKSLHKF